MIQLYKVQLSIEANRVGKSERALWLAGWRQVRPASVANPFGSDANAAPVAAPAVALPRP